MSILEYVNKDRFESKRNTNPSWFFASMKMSYLVDLLNNGNIVNNKNLGFVVNFGDNGIVKDYNRPSFLPNEYKGKLLNGEIVEGRTLNNRKPVSYKYPVPGVQYKIVAIGVNYYAQIRSFVSRQWLSLLDSGEDHVVNVQMKLSESCHIKRESEIKAKAEKRTVDNVLFSMIIQKKRKIMQSDDDNKKAMANTMESLRTYNHAMTLWCSEMPPWRSCKAMEQSQTQNDAYVYPYPSTKKGLGGDELYYRKETSTPPWREEFDCNVGSFQIHKRSWTLDDGGKVNWDCLKAPVYSVPPGW